MNIKKIAIYLVVVLLVITNIITGYYFYSKNLQSKKDNQELVARDDSNEINVDYYNKDTDGDGISNSDEIEKYKTNPNKVDTDGDGYTDKEEIESGHDPLVKEKDDIVIGNDIETDNITIEWNDWLSKVDYWEIFGSQEFSLHKNEKTFIESLDIYKVGTVKNGNYIGKNLYLIKYDPRTMTSKSSMLRVIKNNNDIIVLDRFSDEIKDDDDGEYWGEYKSLFKINKKIGILNLESPKIIKIPNSNYELIEIDKESNKMIFDYDFPEKMFKYDVSNYVYKDTANSNCFLIEKNDGTVKEYSFKLDFIGEKGESSDYASIVPYNLEINWNNGSENKNDYIFSKITGCGGVGCYNYVDYISISGLEKAGLTKDGEIFYESKEASVNAQQDNMESVIGDMYDSYYPGWDSDLKKQKQKVSYNDFLLNHPVLYWQDPFGDFIEFRNAEYLPAVECGKPVIYLYPEEEIDVEVYVKPTGGLTITEPTYNNGWKVNAKPNGELFNYGDKNTYPYLFWEGIGLNYSLPERGFVITREEVKEFLEKKLLDLGLIKKEYDEFIEFWLPKMQEHEYYFITFVPKFEFDKLAPLSVFPEPDTVIRVFMDFKGLDEYVHVEEQRIVRPKRKGFTVVEWGGALRD